MRTEKRESTEEQARSIHEEARMVLPGIQTLFGFQLIAVFNRRFDEVVSADRIVHLSALVLVALAIALIMTPAAYHRVCERDRATPYFAALASALVAAAMVPLLLGITLDIYVVTHLALDAGAVLPSAIVAGAVFIVFFCLWIGFPYLHRMQPDLHGRRRESALPPVKFL